MTHSVVAGQGASRRFPACKDLQLSVGSLADSGNTVNAQIAMRGNMTDQWKPVDARGFCSGTSEGNRTTVLIIDDHEALLDVFEQALSTAGYEVLKASSGREGLRLFREKSADVILCDLCMPLMDGWEVAQAIRDTCEQLGLGKPPFLLVTAWAHEIEGDERIDTIGIAAVLGKPITMNALLRAVEYEVNKRSRELSSV